MSVTPTRRPLGRKRPSTNGTIARRGACRPENHVSPTGNLKRKEDEMRNGAAFCLMFLLLPGLALGQGSQPLQLTTRIALPNVDGRMAHMGVDLAGERLFAAAFDNHTLQVIDLKAGRQVSTIPNLDE